jgi:hypothetical protein
MMVKGACYQDGGNLTYVSFCPLTTLCCYLFNVSPCLGLGPQKVSVAVGFGMLDMLAPLVVQLPGHQDL